MQLHEQMLTAMRHFFDSFESNASEGTSHRSYVEAVKNARVFVVLEVDQQILFVSRQFFETSGFRLECVASEISGELHKSYLEQLATLAESIGAEFSSRADPEWKPHRFFRVSIFD